MTHRKAKIILNDSRLISVDAGRSLFATLQDAQIPVPTACGGRGLCGKCKLRVTGGDGVFTDSELKKLTDEERAEGYRLSCQVKVEDDLNVSIPDDFLRGKEYETVVTSIRDLTYDIKEVKLKLIEPAKLNFKAGQYIQFRVPPYALSDEPVYRTYSIASPPSQTQEIELEIRYVPNGVSTTFVHKHLKEGDAITIGGPDGDFYLRESNRDVVFVAGGSGMAPVKSILMDMAERGDQRTGRYFFGAKARRDLFLVDQMRDLEKRLSHFEFIPVLAAPAANDDWHGETGFVTEVVDRQLSLGKNTEIYLCGKPEMINACLEVLSRKDISDDMIFYDRFG